MSAKSRERYIRKLTGNKQIPPADPCYCATQLHAFCPAHSDPSQTSADAASQPAAPFLVDNAQAGER